MSEAVPNQIGSYREAEAAGKLHHTNIVAIYSTGGSGGQHNYAMELIDGPSLHEVITGLTDSARRAQAAWSIVATRPKS